MTAALAGAGAYTALVQLDISHAVAAAVAALVAFIIRGGALKIRLAAERLSPASGRHPDEIPAMRR